MNASLDPVELDTDVPTETSSAKILLIYRDSDHERLGKQYCNYLIKSLGNGRTVSVSEWKFEMLTCAGMDQMAAAEALAADLVVIATSCGEKFHAGVKRWIKSWCSRTRIASGLLVVLLSECPGYSEAHWPELTYLQEQAARAGMEPIVYASGLNPEEGTSLVPVETRKVTAGELHAIEDFSEGVKLITANPLP